MTVKPQQRREYRLLCDRLRRWREQAGLSQRELSRRMKRPVTFAGKVESRERRIDPIELADWARACGAPSAEVIDALDLRET